jgi:hypothetical protein
MASCTPFLFSGLEGYAIGLIDAIGPVGLGTTGRIVYPVKGTKGAVAGIADIRFREVEYYVPITIST